MPQCPSCGVTGTVMIGGKGYYTCGYRRGFEESDNSECGAFKKEVKVENCTCDIMELFWGGCKCGWFQKEQLIKGA